jgi:hypothetical protein
LYGSHSDPVALNAVTAPTPAVVVYTSHIAPSRSRQARSSAATSRRRAMASAE